MESIVRTFDVVKELLEAQPYYRDNEDALASRVWANELGGDDVVKGMTAYEFLAKYAKGELTSSESIYRAKRRVMEKHEELRGSSYNRRKNELEEEVRDKVKSL